MFDIVAGKSEKDRITFYDSTKGICAIRYNDGTISTNLAFDNYEIRTKFILRLLFFGILCLIKSFVLLPIIHNNPDLNFLYLIPAITFLLVAIILLIVSRHKAKEEGLKNHAAEHMVFAAYQRLKRIPTLEEAKCFSRISPCCGITLYSSFITCQIIGFLVYLCTGYIIAELILFIIALLCCNFSPFNALGKLAQLFTTIKPDDENIKLAIAAMATLEKLNREGKICFCN